MSIAIKDTRHEPPIIEDQPMPRDWIALVLKGLVVYFVVSMCTLPFLNAIWWGEAPMVVIPQLPKLELAGWLRKSVVMPTLTTLGLSKGSYSPDFVRARPYALALAYLIPVGGALAAVWLRTGLVRPYQTWARLLVIAAGCDYLLTLVFASQPALTVY